MFDFSKLKNLVDEQIPYTLFEDEKSLEDSMRPYRVGNEIVTPIFGIFRQNPSTLTAFQSPLIAVVSAIVEIASPSEFLQDVKKTLNDFVQEVNSTAQKVESDGNVYNVIIQAETCSVGQKRRDVGWYNGEIFPVSTVVTFTIVERGVSAFDTQLYIDGMAVPFTNLVKTRTASSEVAPDDHAVGKVSVTQEVFGVTVETPHLDNDLGDLLSLALTKGNGNTAHAVELVTDGESQVYLMGFGTITETAQPPLNTGFSLSMAELDDVACRFNDLWHSQEVAGSTVVWEYNGYIVLWGDGTADKTNGVTLHVYTDNLITHEIKYLNCDDVSRFGIIDYDVVLMNKKIRPKGGYVLVSELDRYGWLIHTNMGDTLSIVNNRVCMTVAGIAISVDTEDPDIEGGAPILKDFVCLLRGEVDAVGEGFQELFGYDRWAVTEG